MDFVFDEIEIRRLLKMEKPLPENFRKRLVVRPKRGHKESELDIKGIDETSEFRLVFRQSITNPLDFSVILGFQIPNSTQVFRLRRYNGKSHEHTNKLENETFYDFHIHTVTERYQDSGFREDAFAETTNKYADFAGAIDCLINDCGLITSLDSSDQISVFEE